MQWVEKQGSDLLLIWFGTFRMASEREVRASWVLCGPRIFTEDSFLLHFPPQESHVWHILFTKQHFI